MKKTINEVIKRKKFKTKGESNSFLLHVGYSIDEVIKINKIKPSKRAIAFERLATIIEFLNDGWYPNWKDSTEYKYFNYFQMQGGFSSWYTNYFSTAAVVPSALCLKSEELAKYAIKHYFQLYKDLYE